MTDALINTQLGQYHLVELIRQGGMATVYKAYQASLERFVAVKVLHHDHEHDPQFAARFKLEARTIAQLQHHNILPVYDYGEQDSLLYLVMQYIEKGATLADVLHPPLAPIPALGLAERLLEALEYAHTHGVIHRDVKPGNVLLPAPDWPMLADFGIAKLLEADQTITMTGQVVGTAAYLAPEQAAGQPVDARADLYALGVVLYEMVTGRVPFNADVPVAVLMQHTYEQPPSPRRINPNLPAVIEPALLRALAKNPDERYQSAAEMAADLRRIGAQLEQARDTDRISSLYQAGVQAFEQGRLAQAIEHLGELDAIAPGYKDSAALLAAAQKAQDHARSAAHQRLTQMRQRYQTIRLGEAGSPGSGPSDGPQGAEANEGGAPFVATSISNRNRSRRFLATLAFVILALLVGGAAFVLSRPTNATIAPPTGAALTALPAEAAPAGADVAGATGRLAWHDDVLWNDAASIVVQDLPPPDADQVYAAWLVGKDGSLALEILSTDGDEMTLSYRSPTHANLLANYDRVYITRVPKAAATTEIANVLMTGALPTQTLVHIRHVLVTFDSTPNKTGFALGLRQEADEILRHANLLKKTLDAGDLAGEKRHAEHLINMIEGRQGEHFGDSDGNGNTQNPGDGFGMLKNGQQLGYLDGMVGHAILAAETPDATEHIKIQAETIQGIGATLRERITDIRDRAIRISQAASVAETQQDVSAILELAQQVIQGVDANTNGQIEPIPGEGGVLAAYQQAQRMADLPFTPGSADDGPPPKPATSDSTPTITITIKDNAFSPSKLTIPIGATVVWKNEGSGEHTVTAEDSSFASGALASGGTFQHTFTKAEPFPYFCQFHGGKAGAGMAGSLLVSERSAAAALQP
jgi:plastocyanin/tRNA A-37 threonylcarbamoyl transferase component Bud32